MTFKQLLENLQEMKRENPEDLNVLVTAFDYKSNVPHFIDDLNYNWMTGKGEPRLVINEPEYDGN